MATYYVKTTGNDTTGDGSDGTPWATPGKAASVMADNDICYVKSGTYTLTTTTPGAAGPVSFTSGITCHMICYETTAGDNCPTDDLPIISAGSVAPTQLVSMNGDFDDAQTIRYLELNGNAQTVSGVIGNANGQRQNQVIGCRAVNCDGTYGFRLVNAMGCYAQDNAGIGFSDCQCTYCWAHANTGDGFDGSVETMQCYGCIATNNSIGFDMNAYNRLINCIARGNSSDGFELAFCASAVNCIATNNAAYGFDAITSGTSVLKNCASHNNTSGRVNGTAIDLDAITLSGDPFVDAAGGDFSLNNTAGAGASCRTAGYGPYLQAGTFFVGTVPLSASGGSVARLPRLVVMQ